MKDPYGLCYVEGPMGAGKSYYGVRTGVRALAEGQWWITNIELLPDWHERAASCLTWWRGRESKRALASYLRSRYIYTTDLEEAFSYGVRPRRRGMAYRPGAVLVWDEGHNDLNNRSWKGGHRNTADERALVIERVTQLRKMGVCGYLLSQSAANTDAAIRRVANWYVRLQNQRERVRLPIVDLPFCPWPLFLAYWFAGASPGGNSERGPVGQPVRLERYFLGWQRHLYDTHGLYHGVASEAESGGIRWLDDLGAALPPGAARRLPAGASAPAGATDRRPELPSADA